MKVRKIEDIVIYRDDRYYCGPGPSIVAYPDGELAVVFRRHRSWTREPMHMHVHPTTEQCLVRSRDGGGTWDRLPRVFMGGGQCAVAGLLRDETTLFVTHRQELVPDSMMEELPASAANERVGVFNRVRSEGGWNERGWQTISAGTEIWRSDDRGDSWDGPSWVGDVPGHPIFLEGLHSPVHLRGFPMELRDGTVLLPVQGSKKDSILIASEDGGHTWEFRGVALAGAFSEWSVVETRSGDLVGFVRSELTDTGGGYLWTARSSDQGRTWSEPKREDVWGFPYFALPLPTGHFLLVNGYRREPFGIRCRVLDPECTNISEAEEVGLREDGGMRDLGYPHAALLPDGRVLVVYYFNDRMDGQRFVAGTFVEVA
jgi:hypothetical protein